MTSLPTAGVCSAFTPVPRVTTGMFHHTWPLPGVYGTVRPADLMHDVHVHHNKVLLARYLYDVQRNPAAVSPARSCPENCTTTKQSKTLQACPQSSPVDSSVGSSSPDHCGVSSSSSIPSDGSDRERYLERRKRNNEAAKRCRANRRSVFQERLERSRLLEDENSQLRLQLGLLRTELGQLQQTLSSKGIAYTLSQSTVQAIQSVLQAKSDGSKNSNETTME